MRYALDQGERSGLTLVRGSGVRHAAMVSRACMQLACYVFICSMFLYRSDGMLNSGHFVEWRDQLPSMQDSVVERLVLSTTGEGSRYASATCARKSAVGLRAYASRCYLSSWRPHPGTIRPIALSVACILIHSLVDSESKTGFTRTISVQCKQHVRTTVPKLPSRKSVGLEVPSTHR